MKTQKLLIPISLALCLIVSAIFSFSAASSRRELPATLSDMNGNTSGIRNLSIEGLIIDRRNNYAYTSTINPQDAATVMHVHKSSGDVTRDMGISYPFIYPSEAVYIPVGETRSEIAESENTFRSERNDQWIPLPEYRIYAELFEVVPLMYAGNLPLALDPDKDRLYIAPAENNYICVISYNGEYEQQQQDYRPGFSVEHSARLHNELAFGEKHLLVPTGKGFYGHTAVYAVDMPGGHVPTVQAEGDNQAYVIARELYPIELERGDEILGLIEMNDGVLLAIQRDGEFELTRIDPETGECITIYTNGEPWLNKYFLTDDSLVLISNYWDDNYPNVHAFDLRNGGLERVLSKKSAELWANKAEGIYYEVKAVIWKDGALYVAVSTQSAMGGSGPGEVQITALAPTGELIGRCKLLCGIEEDYTQFWISDRGSVRSDCVRELKSIALR